MITAGKSNDILFSTYRSSLFNPLTYVRLFTHVIGHENWRHFSSNFLYILLIGPTGVGKTKLSIELAKIYNGEIINADSMQVYIGLDIGTAKIKEEAKENIPHHLFDIKNINEEYSIYNYQTDCRKKIAEILSKNKNDTRLSPELNPYGDGQASLKIEKLIHKFLYK